MSVLVEELLRAAAEYAARGFAVLPVRGKVPVTPHGVHDAVTDPAEVRRLFSDPRVTGVAVACGPRSGLLVVDIDGPEAEHTWEALIAGRGDMITAEVSTGRGRHLWFRARGPGVRNSVGVIEQGIDTRGAGGYAIAPPSLHPTGRRYGWRTRSPILAAPRWLLRLLEQPALPLTVGVRCDPPDHGLTAYGKAALVGLADDLLAAAEGTRNSTLVGVAYRAGRLSAAGELEAGVAHDVLVGAATTVGLPFVEAERTFRSGFGAGHQLPAARVAR